MCVQTGSPRSPFCAPLRVYSAPRSAAPLCRYLCRNEISRSPLSCPWPRFEGGHATRNAVFLSTPHDTQNAERTRSGQRPAHLQIQKRRNAETQKRGRRSSWYGRCQGGSAATACPVESATVTVVLRHGVGWSSWEQHGLSWARKLKAGRAAARTSAQLNSFGTRAAARDMTPAEGAGRYGERRD